jgi:glutamine amidotransferase
LPVYSVNFLLITATDLWALRYPATNELWILQRPAGGTDTTAGLDARTDRIHARSDQLAEHSSVVLASTPFPGQPAHPLALTDLEPTAAASQKSTTKQAAG